MHNLFFELIQVSLGTRICLSQTPSKNDWSKLYKLAMKQSLLGVCFVGIQRLQEQRKELPEILYLAWMGMAAKAQQRNEVLRKNGAELIDRLHAEGLDASILKGQMLATYYGDLGNLRQSGDIDVWVKNRSIMELDAYVKGHGMNPYTTAAHVSYENMGVEIELHSTPAFFRSFWNDRKLQKWFQVVDPRSPCFNLVYMMVHIYHHVFFEGLGLRQLMDYYFVLKYFSDIPSKGELIEDAKNAFSNFGMMRFAQGIMWVIAHVFINNNVNDDDIFFLGIKPKEKYGRLILEDIMTGGNFGHHDEKNKESYSGTVGRSLNGLKRNMKFFTLEPWEILSSPLWSMWHFFWRKKNGLIR